MAYENKEVKKVLDVFSGSDKLYISEGKDTIDIRRYYKNDSGEYAPTKKGLSLKKEFLGEIILALIEVCPDCKDQVAAEIVED
jgi:hypothetical protein